MEILSDTIFKGNVLIKKSLVVSREITEFHDDGSSLFGGKVYFLCGIKTSNNSFIGGDLIVGCSQLSLTVGFGSGNFAAYNDVDLGNNCGSNTKIRGNLLLCLASNTIDFRGNSITFPSKAGTLALTSQIPTVPSVDGFLKYKKVPIDFDVAADCTVFIIVNGGCVGSDKVISLNLFKRGVAAGCGAIKQVQADVWAMDSGRLFAIEKSSAFAISSTDGYEIRAAYYE